jgi:metal transporter CNNM
MEAIPVNDAHKAAHLLQSLGIELCLPFNVSSVSGLLLPLCSSDASSRSLHAQEHQEEESASAYMVNLVGAFVCVAMAALAAGLTLGLVGLDPLMLLIKQRAGTTEQERLMASQLLPIIKQKHLLLVTLLLLNSIANEALPIFLTSIVPPSVAILLSVTLVLFFGEIIPSAVFTGPNQLQLASRLAPLVKIIMLVLYPIAGPIAKLLDHVLRYNENGEHDCDASTGYKRGELAALVRIQYEQRLALKHRRSAKREKSRLLLPSEIHLSSDPSSVLTQTADKSHAQTNLPCIATTADPCHEGCAATAAAYTNDNWDAHSVMSTNESIHPDEVMLMEGALQMKTTVALDVMTSKRRVYSVPDTLILNEHNCIDIYASSYSRIPVYKDNDPESVIGVLLTKQLMVVDFNDSRPLSTFPLYRPICVSPSIRLVDLLNLLQHCGRATRKGCHMALVCARPQEGVAAFANGKPLPKKAGYMGVITMEDVLESLLQEEIYDEMDTEQRSAERLSVMVSKKWKQYKKRKSDRSRNKSVTRRGRSGERQGLNATALLNVNHVKDHLSNELSALLNGNEPPENIYSSFF